MFGDRKFSSGPAGHKSYNTFGGTGVPSGSTDRSSCNTFEVTDRPQVVPQTARIATNSGAQRGPSSTHRPLELQYVPGNREVPLIPQIAVLPQNNNMCITHEHCTLFTVQCEYPASRCGCVTSNGIRWGDDVERKNRCSLSTLCHELCERAGLSDAAHWSCSVFPHRSLKTVRSTGE
jgi:hypothetical protein